MYARLPLCLNTHALVLHVTWETVWVALVEDGQRKREKLVLDWQMRLWRPSFH